MTMPITLARALTLNMRVCFRSVALPFRADLSLGVQGQTATIVTRVGSLMGSKKIDQTKSKDNKEKSKKKPVTRNKQGPASKGGITPKPGAAPKGDGTQGKKHGVKPQQKDPASVKKSKN